MINKFQNSSIVKRIEKVRNGRTAFNPQTVANIVSKNLKALDDRMKSIVDEEKALLEDPFAGLTVNKKIILTCPEDKVSMIIDFANKNNLEWEEMK